MRVKLSDELASGGVLGSAIVSSWGLPVLWAEAAPLVDVGLGVGLVVSAKARGSLFQ